MLGPSTVNDGTKQNVAAPAELLTNGVIPTAQSSCNVLRLINQAVFDFAQAATNLANSVNTANVPTRSDRDRYALEEIKGIPLQHISRKLGAVEVLRIPWLLLIIADTSF